MNIKIISTISSVFLLLVLFTSCGKDNYDEPSSILRGKVTYKGEALHVRGSDERVRLQLYQDGYEKRDPIEVFVGQDGAFSAMLFNGEYKMINRRGNGPWENLKDTVVVNVKGTTEMNLEVIPYFTISNSNITLSGNTMNATFTINKIVESAEIDRVILLINSTAFVDDGYNILRQDFTDNLKTGEVSYSVELNDKAKSAKALNARICVWTKNADQGLYSPIVRLK